MKKLMFIMALLPIMVFSQTNLKSQRILGVLHVSGNGNPTYSATEPTYYYNRTDSAKLWYSKSGTNWQAWDVMDTVYVISKSSWEDSTNMRLGLFAGYGSTADNHISIGAYSGTYNTGTFQITLGNSSGQSNTGDYVTALGQGVATNNTGDFVIAIGQDDCDDNTGNMVVGIGRQNGQSNTADSCLFIGYKQGESNSTDGKIEIDPTSDATPLIEGFAKQDSLIINGTLKTTGILYAQQIVINHLEHGFYTFEGTSTTITCSTNAWSKVTNGTGTLFQKIEDNDGFQMLTGDTIKITAFEYAPYHIEFTWSITLTAGANDDYEARLFNVTKNQIILSTSYGTGDATNREQIPGYSYATNIDQNDRIIMQIRNTSDNDDPTVIQGAIICNIKHY